MLKKGNTMNKTNKTNKTKYAVTKRTYDKNVRKHAKAADDAFRSLMAFVDKYGPACGKAKCIEELSKVVDTYIDHSYAMFEWCHRSGVKVEDFMTDVVNYDGESEKE